MHIVFPGFFRCYFVKPFVMFSVVLILSVFASSCQSSNLAADSSEYFSGQASDLESQISVDESSTIESGTLRLWMQTPDTLNPLLSRQLQWNHMSPLFYEGLYSINKKQETIPLLAKSCIITNENLRFRISIREDVYFHNGEKFTTADVATVLNFLKEQSSDHIYGSVWTNLSRIIIHSDHEITFELFAGDPFFLYNLTFPIVPASMLIESDPLYFPGTGAYQIDSYIPGDKLSASLSNSERFVHYPVKNIDILELSGSREAMAAFGEDRVDVVILDDALYQTYHLRNDLRQSRYAGHTYLFFQLNDEPGKTLHKNENLLYLKGMLNEIPKESRFSSILLPCDVPFLRNSPLLNHPETEGNYKYPGESLTLDEIKEPLKLIYPVEEEWAALYIQRVADVLRANHIPVEITPISQNEYSMTLQSGDYDVAFRKAHLDHNPDPSWLFLEDPFERIFGSDTLHRSTDQAYLEAQSALRKEYLEDNLRVDSLLSSENLKSVCYHSPFSGIGFLMNAVILSKRTNGYLDAIRFNKYNNIEGVWIWSGQ
jgi:hypothetical protein